MFRDRLGWGNLFPDAGAGDKKAAGNDPKSADGDSKKSSEKSSDKDEETQWKSGGGKNNNDGDDQLPPSMKDPWVAALLAAGGGFAAWSLYRQMNQQDYEELVSWKELKTQYLMRGKVCPEGVDCSGIAGSV